MVDTQSLFLKFLTIHLLGNPSLLLEFHGYSNHGSAEWHIWDSKWDIVGEEFGVIVVVSDGMPDSESGTRTWNVSREYDDEFGWRCDPDREEYGESECHFSCTEWCNPSYGCTAGTTCYNDLAFIEQLIDKLIVSFIQNIENKFKIFHIRNPTTLMQVTYIYLDTPMGGPSHTECLATLEKTLQLLDQLVEHLLLGEVMYLCHQGMVFCLI